MDSIPFPFEPYPEQRKLMKQIYTTLDEGGISLLESPTGTGKSLSIICSALHWLTNYNKHSHKSSAKPSKEATPDWVNEFFDKQQKQQQQKRIEQKQELLRKQQKELFNDKQPNKRQKLNYLTNNNDPYLLKEAEQEKQHRTADDWMKIFNKETADIPPEEKENSDIEYRKPQIIYCSRTHSQLLQFVNEIKKTKFNNDNLEILTIGSRKQLCIHPKISKYKSVSKMNESCLNLKDTKTNKNIKQCIESLELTKKSKIKIGIGQKRDFKAMMNGTQNIDDRKLSGCPYLKSDQLNALSLQMTNTINDIEQCHELGKQMQICPYYAIRKGIHSAHLILMPYTSLIHAKTRKILGIDIADSIIIIDEAHNLIENINKIHSVNISLLTLKMAHQQLNQYKTKYINRLKHSNTTKIKTILKVLTLFIHYLSSNNANNNHNEQEYDESVLCIDDLLFDLKIDHINFYDLIDYIQKSEIVTGFKIR